jgi:hypothetical protein
MTKKPDLPILENVSASLSGETDYASAARKNLGYIALKLIFVLIAGFWLWFNLTHKHATDDFAENFVHYLWPLLIVIWALLNIGSSSLLTAFHWETSSEGILAKGYLGQKFTPWADIVKATSSQWSIGHKLVSRHSSMLIPDLSPNWSTKLLGASIWQYLRREGKEDVYELPYSAELLWNQPEIRLAEWKLPRPIGSYFMYLFWLIFVSLLFTMLGYALVDPRFRWMIIPITLVVLLSLIWPLNPLYQAHMKRVAQVEVTEDKIRLTTARGTTELDTKDIQYIDWQQNQLLIGASQQSSLAIPYKYYVTESKNVLLAIVSRLSAIEHPQLLATPRAIIEPPIPPLKGDWKDDRFKNY